jgi:hypothetical protein
MQRDVRQDDGPRKPGTQAVDAAEMVSVEHGIKDRESAALKL